MGAGFFVPRRIAMARAAVPATTAAPPIKRGPVRKAAAAAAGKVAVPVRTGTAMAASKGMIVVFACGEVSSNLCNF